MKRRAPMRPWPLPLELSAEPRDPVEIAQRERQIAQSGGARERLQSVWGVLEGTQEIELNEPGQPGERGERFTGEAGGVEESEAREALESGQGGDLRIAESPFGRPSRSPCLPPELQLGQRG